MRSYDSTKNYGLSLRPKLPMKRHRRMQLGMGGSFTDFEGFPGVTAHSLILRFAYVEAPRPRRISFLL